MNYTLGREVSATERAHISRCPRCRKTLIRLEKGIQSEARPAESQMQGPVSLRTEDAAATPHRHRYAW